MKKAFIIIVAIIATGCFSPFVSAANPSDVVINEIAWMGTADSANDEWLELKNSTNEVIKLDSWLLKTTDGKMKLYLTGQIAPHGFYLLERTDDSSVPEVKADFIYTGALSNTGQSLELYQNSSTLIDSISFSSKWPAGDNATKKTMEKVGNDWQTSKEPGGTPGMENQKSQAPNPKQTQNTNDQKFKTEPEIIISYPVGIIINEVLPSPEGADETNEWIEFKNTTATSINISGWKLQDADGTKTAYVFPENSIVSANGYLVAKRPQTNITLNNDQDSLQLVFPNGIMADSMSYGKASANRSYNKTASQWQWSSTQTPGKANVITLAAAKKTLPSAKKSDINSTVVANTSVAPNPFLAELPKETVTTSNPWMIFFIALGLAIVSAAAILYIKLFRKAN